MGQFTDQLQQINAAQNEILTERKRKQLEKEKKVFLKYLFDKYKLKIIETIEPISNYPYNNILYNDNIINIFANYNKDLKKYNIDDITIKLKLNELEKFTYKEISQQKSRYKKIELEEEKKSFDWKTHLYFLMDRSYKKFDYKAYYKLNNCKFELLEKYKPTGYSYKDVDFFDNMNKKYFKKYPKTKKMNYLSAIVGGVIFGLYKGYKTNNKVNKKSKF